MKGVLIIETNVKSFTPYAKQVKIKLVEMGHTQKWLIDEIKKILPKKYIDTSNLYKIFVGEIKSPEIEHAINQIVGIDESN